VKISNKKTKLLAFGYVTKVYSAPSPPVWPPISVAGSPLKVVDAYKYLGTWFSGNCSLDKEVAVRFGQAIAASNRLRSVWRSDAIGLAINCHQDENL
jgi:hypothetical protein